jgi:hypothetical protein
MEVITCFGQYGHHQVLKCFVGETAALAVAAGPTVLKILNF